MMGRGGEKLNSGVVRTVTTKNWLGAGVKNSSLPSRDQIARPPRPSSCFTPVGGKGST